VKKNKLIVNLMKALNQLKDERITITTPDTSMVDIVVALFQQAHHQAQLQLLR